MKSKNELSIHRKLVIFFSDMALATRGFRPTITPKDAQNLKRVVDLNILSQSKMEQLMLYFLADKNYRNLGPSIATLFSATVLNSLRNKAINRNQFYKELDAYMERYISKEKPREKDTDLEYKEPVHMATLLRELSNKLSLNKANAPRAPVE